MTSRDLVPWIVGAGAGMGVIELDDDGSPVGAHLYTRDEQSGTMRTVEDVMTAHGLDLDHVAPVLINGKRDTFGITFGGDLANLATWLEGQRPELTREDPNEFNFD